MYRQEEILQERAMGSGQMAKKSGSLFKGLYVIRANGFCRRGCSD
jgi:hypothetical protein